MNLTISIVNYNAGDYLITCLQSLEKVKDEAKMKISVVDNASTDGSINLAKAKFPKVKFILNDENVGFGRAHNQVLKDLDTKYVLILNPDTEVRPGVIQTMISYMEDNPGIGTSTCEVVLPNGQVDLTAHRGFPTPYAALRYFLLKDESLYHLSKLDLHTIHEVDAISGSFMLTRRSVLNKVGLFDEDYFMYSEDIDLCYRIKQAGYKVMYVPTISIIHHKGVSSGLKKFTQEVTTATLETRLRSVNAFYSTMEIFYKKHIAENYPFFVNWLVYLGINIKWFLAKRKLMV